MDQKQAVVPSPIANGKASFPKGFLWGTASSSYQYEGAVTVGDRGESMWDHFSHRYPERNTHSTGNEAVDFYNRYKEDIMRMKEINMDSFRFSISWARVIPQGKRERGVSEEGIKFYNDLIDELLANGITPLATLFHWDIPQDLEDEYGGFLSEQIIDDFRDYASLCFERFGDRVKLWITHNEPWVYSVAGYDTGKKAPGRASKYVNSAAVAGMSGYEAYIVSHNMLLSHAEAVEVFRKSKNLKDGKIGLAHNPLWYEPYDPESPEDVEACVRTQEFMFGWHQHPTTFGDYPEVMKKLVGDRLPSFTPKQSEKLKKSYDFVGINYYSSVYARNLVNVDPNKPTWNTDKRAEWMKENKDGKILGRQAGMEWFLVYPEGLRNILKYVKEKYDDPAIIITENGYGETPQNSPMYNPSIDKERLQYHEEHIHAMHQSIYEDGVKVEGYFAWSLLDNFEWNCGYGLRFGLYYIDYKDGLKRYPKMSAIWFKEFLKKRDQKEDGPKEKENDRQKETYGQHLLHSIADSHLVHSLTDHHNWLGHGNLPAVLGSLFVVSATVGTSLFFKGSNH